MFIPVDAFRYVVAYRESISDCLEAEALGTKPNGLGDCGGVGTARRGSPASLVQALWRGGKRAAALPDEVAFEGGSHESSPNLAAGALGDGGSLVASLEIREPALEVGRRQGRLWP
jgi:hypothetical protein